MIHRILEYLRIDKNLKLSVNIQLLGYYLVYTETRLSYSLIFLYIINITSDSSKHDNDH